MTISTTQLIVILALLGLELVLLAFAYWSLQRQKKSGNFNSGDFDRVVALLEKQLERRQRISEAAAAIEPVQLAQRIAKYASDDSRFFEELNKNNPPAMLFDHFMQSVHNSEELIELLINALAIAGKSQPPVEESAAPGEQEVQIEQLQAALAKKGRKLEKLRKAAAEREVQSRDREASEQAEQLRVALEEKERELEALRNESAAAESEEQNEDAYRRELEYKVEVLAGRLAQWQELLKKAKAAQASGRIEQELTELEQQLDELSSRLAAQTPAADEHAGIQEQVDLLRAESLFLVALQSMTPFNSPEQ